MSSRTLIMALAFPLAAAGCTGGDDGGDSRVKGGGKDDSSAEAVFLDFEFDGEVLSSWAGNPNSIIEDQLLYTIGHLNGERSLGRLDKLELTDIATSDVGGKTLITYHAKMPVAWARAGAEPDEYTFQLPRDMSYDTIGAFADKYGHDCVDWGAHDVTSGSMWYYYRPKRSNCSLDDADIITTTAAVSPSPIATTGKFPEYHKVWEDNALRVVAIFGKNEAGTTSGDPGISAYNSMARKVRDLLSGEADYQKVPADAPDSPGAEFPDVTFSATLADGKQVEVVVLLVDGVRVAGPEFDARYEALTPTADLISYAGHSGLGANIRAMATKGEWVTGQYAVVVMNGCDTYAYVDSSLADAHAAVNPDDPTGTKYVDIVTNAMPAFFHSNASNIMAFVNGLLSYEEPRTFEQIFAGVDSAQVVLVSGEADNEYVPGFPGGGGEENWAGMSESGSVAANEEVRYQTPVLAAGRYVFEMTGSGDADLYVRMGDAPTTELYDCRPYRTSSEETCVVELPSAAAIHVMVRGWAASSDFQLDGAKE